MAAQIFTNFQLFIHEIPTNFRQPLLLVQNKHSLQLNLELTLKLFLSIFWQLNYLVTLSFAFKKSFESVFTWMFICVWPFRYLKPTLSCHRYAFKWVKVKSFDIRNNQLLYTKDLSRSGQMSYQSHRFCRSYKQPQMGSCLVSVNKLKTRIYFPLKNCLVFLNFLILNLLLIFQFYLFLLANSYIFFPNVTVSGESILIFNSIC